MMVTGIERADQTGLLRLLLHVIIKAVSCNEDTAAEYVNTVMGIILHRDDCLHNNKQPCKLMVYCSYAHGKKIGRAWSDLLTIKTLIMKKVLAIAALTIGLASCGDNTGSGVEQKADTPAAPYDTSNTRLDTSAIHSGDSTGINRDTSRSDRTDVRKPVDTTTRRRSDTLR